MGRWWRLRTAHGRVSDAVLPSRGTGRSFREVHRSLVASAGPFRRQVATRRTKGLQYDVVLVTCELERASVEAKVVFDGQGTVAGLFFLPVRPWDGTSRAG